MTPDERERALKLLAIARDPTKPMAARKSAATEVGRIKAKLTATTKAVHVPPATPDPASPERPAALFPEFDQRAMALAAKRWPAAKGRVVDWDQFTDSF